MRCEPLPKGLPVVARSVITSLPDWLRAAQAAFERTGGLHAAGLFETDGSLVAIREDVGRHNALDKVIGSRVRAREMPLWDRILMVSGRVSFEIVQKAADRWHADHLRGVGAIGSRGATGRPARASRSSGSCAATASTSTATTGGWTCATSLRQR